MRTTLYVPGDRPDRFGKALASGADAIIIDLEDAVAEPAKADARSHAAAWLADNQHAPAWVRVNNRPDLLPDDLAMALEFAPLGVVMPKAEPQFCDLDGKAVVALVESASGVQSLNEIANVPAVQQLAIGEADLAADLGMDPSPGEPELWAIRSQVVVASAAAGLAAPTGPVWTALDDSEGLATSSNALRRQGFGGRPAIHPAQVPIINDVFTPSASELAHAQAVIAAYETAQDSDSGVAVVNGEFVDLAVVRRSRNVLARAGL